MIKSIVRKLEAGGPGMLGRMVVAILNTLSSFVNRLIDFGARVVLNPLNNYRNRNRHDRRLEIGPGFERIPGYETVNIRWNQQVDYVADASKRLPFATGTFEKLYASHVFEHIAWYRLAPVLSDWVRVLKDGGEIDIWVPDGLKIARNFVLAEDDEANEISLDGWYRFNDSQDPCLWMNGRTFSYGDGRGTAGDPNWHLTLFSPRYVRKIMREAGLVDITRLRPEEVRGYDHGWINMGYRGTKPLAGHIAQENG
ncbi:methyltransferase domain-containing protein [Halioglobus maricola]|uniref:Methyltransferase domain-containing protein n=1 Tax=Halioglobus maricola TaxID=2601894 RepID=A0A5P9NFW0_9GAMM|nr:methyltransferase domain-containing protein [Halioglobus maricola]QFU74680.1 methyltransferase domain-containing protein [Halioglobus maricola]